VAADAEPLSPLAELWAYITLGASSIVTEELSPIVGGVAASQGELDLARVFVAVAVGSWVATGLLYALGRWRGRWVRRRWPRIAGVMVRLLRAVRRRPWRSALAVRWAIGARVILPIACGAAHLRLWVYLLGTAVSAVTWSAVFVGLGYAFGDAAAAALDVVRRYDQWVAALLVAAAAAAWVAFRRRRAAPPPTRDVGR
jgi:membrane protein DedA with SNARE-associated domain